MLVKAPEYRIQFIRSTKASNYSINLRFQFLSNTTESNITCLCIIFVNFSMLKSAPNKPRLFVD